MGWGDLRPQAALLAGVGRGLTIGLAVTPGRRGLGVCVPHPDPVSIFYSEETLDGCHGSG